jgi:molybdate transport system regulatory protein
MPIQEFLKNPEGFSVVGKLWIYSQDERFFGPGRVELLEKIQATGSINMAAKQMQMSYKKAWEMVNSMNNQAARPLVTTQTGGKKGGGAEITPEAIEIINYFKGLHQRFQDFLANETQNLLKN